MDGLTLEQIQNVGYAQVEESPSNLATEASTMAEQARQAALNESVFQISVQAGMAHQFKIINATIKKNERQLDTVYDFGSLMSYGRVVPPVIIEAHDLYNQNDAYTIRLSADYYHIEAQAYFSSRPPSWRNYLNFEVPVVNQQKLLNRLRPRNSAEMAQWRITAKEGWDEGIRQANIIFISSFDLLNRDFIGMIRYKIFELEGKVSMPIVSSENLGMTNTGETLVLNEELLRITTLPSFSSKSESWRATPILSPAATELMVIPEDKNAVRKFIRFVN